MRYTWLDEFLMKKTGVVKDRKEEWYWVRYRIGGKLFAALCLDQEDKPYYITLKLDPQEGDFLRQQYEDIVPGYYMNKTHWNSVKPDGAVPDDLLKDMLDKSYDLVFQGLGKKKQQEILAAEQVTCCGSACRTCGCYGSLCKGCNETRGRVFHAPEGRACPIYACAVEQKELKSCKTCGSLPCEIWMQTKDPSMSQEAFERNVKERAERLKRQ